MKYAAVKPITKAEAEAAFESQDAIAVSEALLRATLHVDDPDWIEGKLLQFLADANDATRRMACVCCGHLVRIHGCVSAGLIGRLHELCDDPIVGGAAEDALEDLKLF